MPTTISALENLAASPRVTFGPGAVQDLPAVAERFADDRPLLVLTGRSSGERAWLPGLLARMPRHVFATLPGTYPSWDGIERIVDLMASLRTGATIAIGGGSVLDTAKVAASRANETRGGRRRAVVAVPTTPGTGAEVTPFATVWDFAGLRKHSYYRRGLVPDAAVIDPDLISTLTRDQLGSAVLDTLAQGMEAAWSTGSTPEAADHGLGAVALAAQNLERLLADPQDADARRAVSLAGMRSGVAIANARTTLCHALSYPLTLHYGIRHGHACGLTLGAVLTYNSAVTAVDCRHPAGVGHVRATVGRVLDALGCGTPSEATARIDTFLDLAGLPAYRHAEFDDALLAAESLGYDRAGNNPRAFGPEQLTALLNTLH